MLELLFKFPIVMVDGDSEEKKHRLDLPNDDGSLDLIYGEAEIPYHDFVGVVDRWLPTRDSLERALDRDFDACFVNFGAAGSFLVPWSKEKFKREFKKFTLNIQIDPDSNMRVINNKRQLIDFIKELPEDEHGDHGKE